MDDEFDLLKALGDDTPVKKAIVTNINEVPEIEKLAIREEILEIHEDGTVIPVESLTDKAECLRQITNILGEYSGLESNIPVNNLYWKLINRYRVM